MATITKRVGAKSTTYKAIIRMKNQKPVSKSFASVVSSSSGASRSTTEEWSSRRSTTRRATAADGATSLRFAPGLSGRTVRFGSLRDCAETAVSGVASKLLPGRFPKPKKNRSAADVLNFDRGWQ